MITFLVWPWLWLASAIGWDILNALNLARGKAI